MCVCVCVCAPRATAHVGGWTCCLQQQQPPPMQARAPARFSPPPPAPAHNAPIRTALAGTGPPLVLAVHALADGDKQGCMRASRQREEQPGAVWCGVVWCSVGWCGMEWCGVVWCGVEQCGAVQWARRAMQARRCKHSAARGRLEQQLVLLTPPLPPPPPSSHAHYYPPLLMCCLHGRMRGGEAQRSPAHRINSAHAHLTAHTRAPAAGRRADRQAQHLSSAVVW